MSETSRDGAAVTAHQAPPVDLRHLTEGQLASLGVAQIAYVRPVLVNGERAFSIHAADGTPMAVAADFGVAIAAVMQHEMLPALVH